MSCYYKLLKFSNGIKSDYHSRVVDVVPISLNIFCSIYNVLKKSFHCIKTTFPSSTYVFTEHKLFWVQANFSLFFKIHQSLTHRFLYIANAWVSCFLCMIIIFFFINMFLFPLMVKPMTLSRQRILKLCTQRCMVILGCSLKMT